MTKFKVYRVSPAGMVTIDIVEAFDWQSAISQFQWAGDSMFRIEIYGGQEPIEPPTYTS